MINTDTFSYQVIVSNIHVFRNWYHLASVLYVTLFHDFMDIIDERRYFEVNPRVIKANPIMRPLHISRKNKQNYPVRRK